MQRLEQWTFSFFLSHKAFLTLATLCDVASGFKAVETFKLSKEWLLTRGTYDAR